MNNPTKKTSRGLSRRSFMAQSLKAGTFSLVGPNLLSYPGGSDRIRVGLVGCGGRGTGAGIIDCAESSPGIELTAIGDLFKDHLDAAPEAIKSNLAKRDLKVDDIYKVTPEHTFLGFDAYQKVIDSGVDMVILTTPPNFRPQHLKYAVEKGKHVFIEKPIAVDPVGVRSVLASSEVAREKGLTIVAGTQMRRLPSNIETIQRIHDGAIGQLIGGQVFRAGSGMRNWRSSEKIKQSNWSEMEYQIRRWLMWNWLSGDFVVEMHVHNLDIMNWIMGAPPAKCLGMGGRQARVGFEYGNNYDHFSAELHYPNGAQVAYMGAQIDTYASRNHQRVVGSKGSAILDFSHGEIMGSNPFMAKNDGPSPSVRQYRDMIESIRMGKAINECKQIADSTITGAQSTASSCFCRRRPALFPLTWPPS